jgi:hypothetical protein
VLDRGEEDIEERERINQKEKKKQLDIYPSGNLVYNSLALPPSHRQTDTHVHIWTPLQPRNLLDRFFFSFSM